VQSKEVHAMRPVFADPRNDYVFKRLFGRDGHPDLLMALLNDLLELDAAHRIVGVSFDLPEQRPVVAELKHSIVDVLCTDAQGTRYVVEMQVLNVEGFEKRVVYNVSKAYVHQLWPGEGYPRLNDVVGVTICDFLLFAGGVPMLSRWRMQEQHTGLPGLPELQFVFLELPKLSLEREPRTPAERWAYYFRKTSELASVPGVLGEPPFVAALDAARVSGFSIDEWEAYDRARLAEESSRAALSLARKEGLAEGQAKGELRAALLVAEHRFGPLSEGDRARLSALEPEGLVARLLAASGLGEVLG
jgi:predicted transposase/invertase (TIGR01784 family)